MGKASLLLVAGMAITITMYSSFMNRNASLVVKSYSSYYSRLSARNANAAAMQAAMRTLADNTAWTTGWPALSIAGGTVRVTVSPIAFVTAPFVGRQGATVTVSSSYYADSLLDKATTLTSSATVAFGIRPVGIIGAWTALGGLNQTISNMYIDGRDHLDIVDTLGIPGKSPNKYRVVPNDGVYGIATGAATFSNTNGAFIGGTNEGANPWKDYAPTYPESSKIILTNAYASGGFPKGPDQFMGWPDSTLMKIAKAGTNGSRYITRQGQLDTLVLNRQPLSGVTFVDVKHVTGADTMWSKVNLYKGSGGILAVHCTTPIPSGTRNYTAYFNDVDLDTLDSKGKVAQDKSATFKGLIIFDKVFHFHMNCLGGVAMLTPFTETGSCAGNNDMTAAFSGSVVAQVQQAVLPQVAGGWRGVLTVVNWQE